MENPDRPVASDQRGVWERIADSFDRSRSRTWPHVKTYLAELPAGSRVLDLMCGNGRHTDPAVARHRTVAFDWSRGLVGKVHARTGVGVVGDATRLPFQTNAFDACIYVAGWHGIPTEEGRMDSLRELHRVLRPGGTAQITSWSRDAPRFQGEGTPGEPVDTIIPWRSDGHDEQRTYHLTTLEHLVDHCVAAGFTVLEATEVAIVNSHPDNLVVTVQK